eukprot:15364541-Ditylum_brightwellii.AAC.2
MFLPTGGGFYEVLALGIICTYVFEDKKHDQKRLRILSFYWNQTATARWETWTIFSSSNVRVFTFLRRTLHTEVRNMPVGDELYLPQGFYIQVPTGLQIFDSTNSSAAALKP